MSCECIHIYAYVKEMFVDLHAPLNERQKIYANFMLSNSIQTLKLVSHLLFGRAPEA